jgi:hypothetical protein
MMNDILNIPKNKIFGMFDVYSSYIQKLQKLRKDYNISDNSNFNIFSSISDVYHKENLHSDIIRLILDPETDEIGNPENIKLFVKMLRKKKPELKIMLGKNVNVEREKGRIDILLYDDENAIIIESKINYHEDEPNQIGGYYEKISKEWRVNAIVYLTLTPEQTLNEKRSIKNPKTRKKIKELGLIIPIPVIDEKGETNFSDHFIGECYKVNSKKVIPRVYYSEYNKLLKHLGGDAMFMDEDMVVIKEIYEDKQKLQNFTLFGGLWKRKDKVITKIIRELLQEKNFQMHIDDKIFMCRKIDADVSLCFHLKNFTFGFIYTPGTKKSFSKVREELESLLKKKELKDIFCKDDTESDETTVWRCINFNKMGSFENILTNFEILEKLYKGSR